MGKTTGSSFAASTETENFATLVAPCASRTSTVISLWPACSSCGTIIRQGTIPATPYSTYSYGTNVGLDDRAVMRKSPAVVSTSETVKVIAPLTVASSTLWSEIAEIIGRLLVNSLE